MYRTKKVLNKEIFIKYYIDDEWNFFLEFAASIFLLTNVLK